MSEDQFELDIPAGPTRKAKVGIIDADSIMFNLGWYFEKKDILPKGGDYSNSTRVPPEIETAVDTFLDKLADRMNVDSLHLHFTGGAKNKQIFEEFYERPMREQFRNTLGNTYKSNRKNAELPTGYHYTLRSMLTERPNSVGYIHDEFEADEAVILHKKLNPNWVLASNDKDVYNQHHGRAFLYDKRVKKGVEFMDVKRDFANYFPFLQAITGDPVDGFGGVPGIGPAKAEKFVSVTNTPTENWEGVLRAFESKGLDEREALINMRFAAMGQLKINKQGEPYVNLWKPDAHHLTPYWSNKHNIFDV